MLETVSQNIGKNISTALNTTVLGFGKALNDLPKSLRLTISSGAGFP